jgi:hypothetical protein
MEEESGEDQEDWGSHRSERSLGGLPYEGLPYEDDYKMVMFEEYTDEPPILAPPPQTVQPKSSREQDLRNLFPVKKNLSAYNYFLKERVIEV